MSKEHLVVFLPSGRRERVPDGQSLLEAASGMGVEIESVCGGRLTCGKCKVQIEEGSFAKHGIVSSQDHVSAMETGEENVLNSINSADCRLACSTHVHGDLVINVPEESRALKQIIRKTATEKVIEINSAIKQVMVEVKKPVLGEHIGDWKRLQDALKDEWGFENLTIDLMTLRSMQAALRKNNWLVTVTIWKDKEVIEVSSGSEQGAYGLSVDVGTTSVSGHLVELRTGEILASRSMMNPQVKYGEDIMSRISYSVMNKDGLQKMNDAIITGIQDLADEMVQDAAKEHGLKIETDGIHEAVMVGNTTMTSILLGIDPEQLGYSPFTLANRFGCDIKARDMGLRFCPSGYVHILPSEAGHVGADNVGALIAEEPYKGKDAILMADVGTNAEITLGNKDEMYCASSPTGPAFEGAQVTHGIRATVGAIERVRIDPDTYEGKFKIIGNDNWSDEWSLMSSDKKPKKKDEQIKAVGICGSGIIEVVACMFQVGIIDGSGKFNDEIKSDRIIEDGRSYVLAPAELTSIGKDIVVTQLDVRNIQLAKAALYAGAKILMMKSNFKNPKKIVLAGAFGSYIDPKYAMMLGMIPDCSLEDVHGVGNAAGDGARLALLSLDKRKEAQEVADWIQYVETATDPAFQDEFMNAIHIPNKVDEFPSLEGFLPED